MPAVKQARQRKTHRKSRTGCSSCRLRSVKASKMPSMHDTIDGNARTNRGGQCDEAKPSCRRCLSSGFTCSYGRNRNAHDDDLHFSQAGVFKVDLTIRPALHRHIPLAHPVAGTTGMYELRQTDLRLLDGFASSTWLTLGGGEKVSRSWYAAGVLGLSSSHPFLLHIFMVLSQLHALHERRASTARTLAFHWYHGAALFQQMLSRALVAPALSSSERDTLWIAAAMLGTATFAYLGPPEPREAWPLAAPTPSDLDWLKMGTGKKVIWDLADPTRPDSLFNQKALLMTDHPPPSGQSPIRPHVLPAPFHAVFHLDSASTPKSNPYHVAASLLSQLLPQKPTPFNVHHFLSFMSQMDPRYQDLLVDKDPRALVLLLHWMAKMASYPMWWTRGRVLYEGLAIAAYIERECPHQQDLMALICHPRALLFAVREQVEATKGVEIETAS